MAQPPKHFTSGEIVRWRRVGGLTLAEVTFEPGRRIHRERHTDARWVLVMKGALTETSDAGSTLHGPSTLLFRRADEARSYAAADRGATCLIVEMDGTWVARARQQAPVIATSMRFKGGLLLHLAHRLYAEFRLRDEVSRLAIESLTLGLLAEASRRVARAERAVPVWLQLALALIEQDFAEPLPLVAVAKRVGVHPVHLARTFRRVYQTPLASYVRQLRVEFARVQLGGPAPLSEIASAAGFCDQSHFSRCFKRLTGLTPAEYRASLR